MRRAAVVIIASFFVFSILAHPRAVYTNAEASSGSVHNLDTGLNYTRIQEAIDAPETVDGHTIEVDEGTYQEVIIVNKSISLIGQDRDSTVIHGSGSRGVMKLIADRVTIDKFTIRHGRIQTEGPDRDYYGCGIEVYSSFNTITNTKIADCDSGIYLFSRTTISPASRGNVLTNNSFSDISLVSLLLFNSSGNILRGNSIEFANSGNGMAVYAETIEGGINDVDTTNTIDGKPIYYWVNQAGKQVPDDAGYVVLVNSTRILVEDILPTNVQGMSVLFTNETTIERNTFSNAVVGIYFSDSHNNTLKDNLFSNCKGYGMIFQGRSSHNVIRENVFIDNGHSTDRWDHMSGIYIDWGSWNVVSDNVFRENGIGIEISSNNNQIFCNEIINNDMYGILLRTPSSGNLIVANNFSNNGYVHPEWGDIGGSLIVTGSGNTIYHNNFFDPFEDEGIDNTVTNGYPSGGNYYSDSWYAWFGPLHDSYSGPEQDQPGSDGISDESVLPYSLMGSITYFSAINCNGKNCFVHVITKSTLSKFDFDSEAKSITLTVRDVNGASGFVRAAIPKELLWTSNPYDWSVEVAGISVVPRVLEDAEYSYLYISYLSSGAITVRIQGTHIIPEPARLTFIDVDRPQLAFPDDYSCKPGEDVRIQLGVENTGTVSLHLIVLLKIHSYGDYDEGSRKLMYDSTTSGEDQEVSLNPGELSSFIEFHWTIPEMPNVPAYVVYVAVVDKDDRERVYDSAGGVLLHVPYDNGASGLGAAIIAWPANEDSTSEEAANDFIGFAASAAFHYLSSKVVSTITSLLGGAAFTFLIECVGRGGYENIAEVKLTNTSDGTLEDSIRVDDGNEIPVTILFSPGDHVVWPLEVRIEKDVGFLQRQLVTTFFVPGHLGLDGTHVLCMKNPLVFYEPGTYYVRVVGCRGKGAFQSAEAEIVVEPTSKLTISVYSPVSVLVTAPDGLRVGYDPATKEAVNEISGATYSGSEPQRILIPNPAEAAYQVTLLGKATGHYTLRVEYVTPTQTVMKNFSGSIVEGETQTLSIDISGGEMVFRVLPQPFPWIFTAGICAAIAVAVSVIWSRRRLKKHGISDLSGKGTHTHGAESP